MSDLLFTQDEVFDLCRDAGWLPYPAKIASAIAMCESATFVDGKPMADFSKIGDQDLANAKWGNSIGGFQIRSLRAQKGTGKWRDEDRLLRPWWNARSARHIKNTQGWTAWSVYNSGQYRAYLQDLFPPPRNTYVVTYGDTLSGIGQRLGIEWQELARVNNLHHPYALQIGQILNLP